MDMEDYKWLKEGYGMVPDPWAHPVHDYIVPLKKKMS
jgi:hypothetical protein